MLRRLRIDNLVLIREAELELAPGLVALTGETGAGKTIVTQAIGLLLGAKGDAAAVGAAGGEAYVEGSSMSRTDSSTRRGSRRFATCARTTSRGSSSPAA